VTTAAVVTVFVAPTTNAHATATGVSDRNTKVVIAPRECALKRLLGLMLQINMARGIIMQNAPTAVSATEKLESVIALMDMKEKPALAQHVQMTALDTEHVNSSMIFTISKLTMISHRLV
jgi:hypothetical protein